MWGHRLTVAHLENQSCVHITETQRHEAALTLAIHVHTQGIYPLLTRPVFSLSNGSLSVCGSLYVCLFQSVSAESLIPLEGKLETSWDHGVADGRWRIPNESPQGFKFTLDFYSKTDCYF